MNVLGCSDDGFHLLVCEVFACIEFIYFGLENGLTECGVQQKNKDDQTYETYVIKIQCIQCLTGFYSSQGRWDICDNAQTQSLLKQESTHRIKMKRFCSLSIVLLF